MKLYRRNPRGGWAANYKTNTDSPGATMPMNPTEIVLKAAEQLLQQDAVLAEPNYLAIVVHPL
jgi:hypothetical protein